MILSPLANGALHGAASQLHKIVEDGLCLGCGVCTALAPKAIDMNKAGMVICAPLPMMILMRHRWRWWHKLAPLCALKDCRALW